jgi:tetratricopeptide (TPR) repeat protein
MPQSNELRIFISSTFRDLQEEREHLIKKIFPEIRSLCRERGITFTEVDLRWGLTEEQAALGTVIRTCLEEIDKCRPYFIGMLGSRYGWVPELHEIMMDPDLLAKYPWVEDVVMEGVSVTEMEFIHGVFNAPEVDSEYAFFYHRSGEVAEADDPERLASLIERSRATGHPFREFESTEELGQEVHDDLVAMIDRYWPQSEAPSALELERRSHSAFAASRLRAYIPNPSYLKEFTQWLSEGAKPFVVRGDSGLGKSSLVAYLVEYYRRKHPAALVVEHYVGASRMSGSAVSVMQYIIEDIRDYFKIDEELPAKDEEIEKSFANWLFRCEHLAAQQGTAVLIAVDAVNQLGTVGRRMTWLPKTIPQGVKLIISTTPGETEDRLTERAWDNLIVTSLEDERVRQSIVVRYLGEFHKGITSEQVRRVTGDAKASSPLYLRVVAEELRLHGEYETLDRVIDRYVGAEDLLGVFDLMLERIEHDYGAERVRDLMSGIWGSRAGLSEMELMEIAGTNRMDLSRFLFAIDYHFVQRQGVLGFFHDYLRRAVEKRYLSMAEDRLHLGRRLASYFADTEMTLRTTLELLHVLESSGDREELLDALAEIERLDLIWSSPEHNEVLRLWAGSDPATVVATYRASLARWVKRVNPVPGRYATILRHLGDLFDRIGALSDADGVLQECLRYVRDLGDRRAESAVLTRLTELARSLGRPEEARLFARNAEGIARELGDPVGVGAALTSRATLHFQCGEYDESLACSIEAESIARDLGDQMAVCDVVANRAILYAHRAEFDRALGLFAEAESIARDLGDRGSIARSVGNRGTMHRFRGEFEQALICFDETLTIARELGDRRSIAVATGNRAAVYHDRGEYAEALACFTQEEAIQRELGDQRNLGVAIGNRGFVYEKLGMYDQALECFETALDIHRTNGNPFSVVFWLIGIADALHAHVVILDRPYPKHADTTTTGDAWKQEYLARARACLTEAIATSQELSMPTEYYLGRLKLAHVDIAEGNLSAAIGLLEELLLEDLNDEQRGTVHYHLWKVRNREEDRAMALRCYTQAYAKTPKQEFRETIDELTAAANSAEATDASE